MIRAAWFLARHDLKYMLRARETILWTFLMPIVFFFFIGSITGGFGRRGGEAAKDPLVLDVDPRAGYLASYLERSLEEVGFDVQAPTEVPANSTAARLAIPAAFTDSVLAGGQSTVVLTRQGEADLTGDYDRFRVQRAVFSLLGNLAAAAGGDHPPSAEALDIVMAAPHPLTLQVAPAGTRRRIPTGFEQAVPGTMVMFTLLVLLTSGAVNLVIERQEGLLRRLASAPIDRRTLLLGKWGGRMMLGAIQIAFALIVGTVLFKMRWGPNAPMLMVVLLFYAGLVALLGILLGSLARSEGQAVGLGVLTANAFAALGGCWWPIEITPAWMQKFALVFPTGWAMNALHKLVSFGAPPESVVPHLAVFAVAIAVAAWASVRAFRFQ